MLIMVVTKTFSIAKDVEEMLDSVPRGKKSEIINEAVRYFFETESPIEKGSQKRKSERKMAESEYRYPPVEISVDDL